MRIMTKKKSNSYTSTSTNLAKRGFFQFVANTMSNFADKSSWKF